MRKKCFIGFDGYRDEIYRLIKRRTKEGYEFWDKMEDLGSYLQNNCGKSSDIELMPAAAGIGGNGPLMAGAIASLGIQTTCMGLFDDCRDLMENLNLKVDCLSIGRSNRCTALEFSNGKLMLGQLESMKLDCDNFKNRFNQEEVIHIWRECSLIGIVNWSAFLYMNDILAFLEPFLMKQEMPQLLFFDLADLTARSREDILELVSLLKRFGKRKQVILGLNNKEAEIFVQQYMNIEVKGEQTGKILAAELRDCLIVIHGIEGARCYWKQEQVVEKTQKVEQPKILTGAGDHFNAGFCCGMINKLGLRDSLRLGNKAAGYYVRYGRNMEEI